MKLVGLRIALVGPLAPSAQADGHACAALAQHLRAEGASVHLIQSALKHAPGYLLRLWRAAKTVDLIHKQAHGCAVLILAGAVGEEEGERLEQLVAELKLREKVQFSTPLDQGDMARLYQACDIMLHNGPDDCLPPLVENGMTFGLPVIAIHGAAYSDTLRDRENALLVAPAQPEAMACAALELIDDPALAARLGAAARTSVRHKDWEHVASQLLAHYRRLLGTPSLPLYTRLASALLFPLQEWDKRHRTVAIARQLEQTQWWDSERLEQLRFARLRALLLHAGTHVPYYRALFERCSFDPLLVNSVADLARLPLLTKADIIGAGTRMTSRQPAV